MRVDSTSAGELLMATLERTAFEAATVTLDNTRPHLSYRLSHPTIRAHLVQAGEAETVEIAIAFVPPVLLVSPSTTTTSTTTTTTTVPTTTTTTTARPAPPVPTSQATTTTTTGTLQPLTTTTTTTVAPACTAQAVFTSTSTTVSTSPGPCNLYGVATGGTGEDAWAVGQDGTVLATTDGGASWAAEAGVPTSENLRAVYFSPGTTDGWAVGDGGTILSTADGSTWSPETSGTPSDLLGVAFAAGGQLGVAVGAGGTVLTTANGGQQWGILTSTGTTLNAVAFSSASTAVAVGDSGAALQMSYDGAWFVSAVPTGVSSPLYGVAFFGPSAATFGLAVGGGGTMVEWYNGSWFSEPSNTSADLRGVAVGQYAVAVGGDGTFVLPGCVGTANNAGTHDQLNAVALWSASSNPFVAVGDGGMIVPGQGSLYPLPC